MDLWGTIATERRRLADELSVLTPEQWATQSLCGEWMVRDVAAHLVMPYGPAMATMGRFAVNMIRARGNFARANTLTTAQTARASTEEIVTRLRRSAKGRFVAPTMPPVTALAEILVHSQDIRIPLGIKDTGQANNWVPVLEFLLTPRARRGFVGPGLPELTWVATDADLSTGQGPRVEGPVAAMALAAMGRPALLDELSGPGRQVLADWLGAA